MDPTSASLQGQHLPLQQVHSWLFQGVASLTFVLFPVTSSSFCCWLLHVNSRPHSICVAALHTVTFASIWWLQLLVSLRIFSFSSKRLAEPAEPELDFPSSMVTSF